MPSRKLKLFIVLFLMVASPLRAEEAAKPAAAPESQSKDQKEYVEKRSKLNTLAARLEDSDLQFKELVKRKAQERNPEQIQAILKEMNENVSERSKTSQQYEKLKSELSMRYPDQGEHLDRNYEVGHRKEAPKVETAAGLDEQLTRVKKIIEKKFAPFNPDPVPAPKHSLSESTGDDEKPKPLRLEK